MSSIEERNVTALERWMHEVFEEGNLDLGVELMASSYVGHGPVGDSYPHARVVPGGYREDAIERAGGTVRGP